MAIISKPVSMAKAVPQPFQLNKTALAAVPKVNNDPFFVVSENWESVAVNYKSVVGNQRVVVVFKDISAAVPSGVFITSLRARSEFEIESIIINDFDNGSLFIPATDLDIAEFSISLT